MTYAQARAAGFLRESEIWWLKYRVNGRLVRESSGTKSREEARRRLEFGLRHLLPASGDRRAVEVTSSDVRAYVARRQAEGAANATVNRELAALKRMFTLGLEAEKIPRRPRIRCSGSTTPGAASSNATSSRPSAPTCRTTCGPW